MTTSQLLFTAPEGFSKHTVMANRVKAEGRTATFRTGQHVLALHNGTYRDAVIRDVEAADDSVGEAQRYYVHWPDLDGRNDKWLQSESIRVSVKREAAAAKAAKANVSTRKSGAVKEEDAEEDGGGKAATVVREVLRSADSKFFCRNRNVQTFVIGHYDVESWYFTPMRFANIALRTALEDCARPPMSPSAPLVVSRSPMACNDVVATRASNVTLHLCPFCLEQFLDATSLQEGHLPYCRLHPPGREVYRDTNKKVLVFESDGGRHRRYCECLALLSKAFLEHKSLDWDMTPFVFYTLCLYDDEGCHVAAYFSREKHNLQKYNLSCILTLPPYQNRGLGRFLVECSHEMSRRERQAGTPERPLSDMGERTYHAFWRESVVAALRVHNHLEGWAQTLDELMRLTGMQQADVMWALKSLKMIDTRTQAIHIHLTSDIVTAHLETQKRRKDRGDVLFDAAMMRWDPAACALLAVNRVELARPAFAAKPLRKKARKWY
jgi:histone acetyltransferase HTATIP